MPSGTDAKAHRRGSRQAHELDLHDPTRRRIPRPVQVRVELIRTHVHGTVGDVGVALEIGIRQIRCGVGAGA